LRNTINQSVQVVCSVYYRLGETVTGRLVSIKRNVNRPARPGEAVARIAHLSAVGCRLSSHYKTKALAKAKAPSTDRVW